MSDAADQNGATVRPSTTARVRIDLFARTLEAEGTEEFIKEMCQDFSELVTSVPITPAADQRPSNSTGSGTSESPAVRSGGTTKRAGGRKASGVSVKDRQPQLVKDLNLKPTDSHEGLRDFADKYRKITAAYDWNGLFVYYLTKIAAVSPITMDHVYTCYKEVEAKVPTKFPQSLWDTARKQGTIEVPSVDDVRLTVHGENWVEHDLQKATKKEQK